MTAALAFDIGLALLVLVVAIWSTVTRNLFDAVVGFIAYGVLLGLVWVRLSSVDIALTEVAIGAASPAQCFCAPYHGRMPLIQHPVRPTRLPRA